jgi:hypothetical protein
MSAVSALAQSPRPPVPPRAVSLEAQRLLRFLIYVIPYPTLGYPLPEHTVLVELVEVHDDKYIACRVHDTHSRRYLRLTSRIP